MTVEALNQWHMLKSWSAHGYSTRSATCAYSFDSCRGLVVCVRTTLRAIGRGRTGRPLDAPHSSPLLSLCQAIARNTGEGGCESPRCWGSGPEPTLERGRKISEPVVALRNMTRIVGGSVVWGAGRAPWRAASRPARGSLGISGPKVAQGAPSDEVSRVRFLV